MNTWLFHFLIFYILILTHPIVSYAEYRVYRLGITYDDKQKKEIEVTTSLDHKQYETYYKVTAAQKTRLIEHWMCHGRTDGYAKYCSKPLSPKSDGAEQNPGPTIQQAQGPSSSPLRAPAQQ